MRKVFGQELRRLRGEVNLTMADVASHMGWSIVYISDIERSKRNPPSLKDIQRLIQFMGKESSLPEMLRLAAESRQTIEIPVNKQGDVEVTNMLVALAREVDQGSIDSEIAKQIQKILEQRKDR